MTDILSPVASIVGGIGSIFGGDDDGGSTQQFNPSLGGFRGNITTPGYTFGGGTLAGTTNYTAPENAYLTQLEDLRTQIGGLRSNVATDRGLTDQALAGIPTLFGRTDTLRNTLGDIDVNLQGLGGQVAPGFGRLTDSLRTAVRGQASEAMGNLRDNLARRGVLGSSFASDALSRVQNEFLKTENEAVAQAFVQELNLSRAIQGDRAALTQIGGMLIQLDQQTIQEQGRLIGLRMGLTDQDSRLLAQNMANIQQQYSILQGRMQRELAELGIATQFLAQVNQTGGTGGAGGTGGTGTTAPTETGGAATAGSSGTSTDTGSPSTPSETTWGGGTPTAQYEAGEGSFMADLLAPLDQGTQWLIRNDPRFQALKYLGNTFGTEAAGPQAPTDFDRFLNELLSPQTTTGGDNNAAFDALIQELTSGGTGTTDSSAFDALIQELTAPTAPTEQGDLTSGDSGGFDQLIAELTSPTVESGPTPDQQFAELINSLVSDTMTAAMAETIYEVVPQETTETGTGTVAAEEPTYASSNDTAFDNLINELTADYETTPVADAESWGWDWA